MKRTLHQFALVLAIAGTSYAADVAVLRNGFTIRHEGREMIGDITRLKVGSGFLEVATDQIASYERDDQPLFAAPAEQTPTPAPKSTFDLKTSVSEVSDRHGIDPDLVASVVRAESGGNMRAVSRKGAQGLMQLMPGTAAQLGVSDAFDGDQNLDGGTRYLRELLLRYNGDMAKALAAYNAGPGRVDKKGIPRIRETRAYVRSIIRDFNRKKLARGAPKKPTPTKTEHQRAGM